MAKIITITNQKGGTGKTTIAAVLAAGLHLKGYKTLLIDLDPQGNLSYSARTGSNVSIYDVLIGNTPIEEVIQQTADGDIIPSSNALSGADLYLTNTGKEYRLKEALEPIKDNYDYIVIDTPPALGILTVNALTASNEIIIPAQADIYSVQGIGQLADTIAAIRRYCNPGLKIRGIILSRYNPRSVLSREITEHLKAEAEALNTKLFNTTIREGIAIKEAQTLQLNIFEYAKKAKITEDYRSFINEYLNERE